MTSIGWPLLDPLFNDQVKHTAHKILKHLMVLDLK